MLSVHGVVLKMGEEGYQLLFAIVEVERVDSILSMIHDIKVVISV